MLEGGVIARRPYLIIGPAGTGKSTLALQFLCEGVRRGERTLLVTIEEPPNELRVNHRGLGVEFDRVDVFDAIPDVMRYERVPFKDISAVRQALPFGRVPLMIRRTPELTGVEVTITALEQMLRSEVTRRGYTRVVIDSLTALQYFCMKGFNEVAGAQSFLRFLSDLHVTTFLTVESPLEDADTTERMLARGEIRLFRWEVDNGTVYAVGVEKFRGGSHDVRLHPYRIGPNGIDITLDRTISRDTRRIVEPEPVVTIAAPPPSSPIEPLIAEVEDLVAVGADVVALRTEVEAALAATILGDRHSATGHVVTASAISLSLAADLRSDGGARPSSVPPGAEAALRRIVARSEAARAGIPPTELPPSPELETQLQRVLARLPVAPKAPAARAPAPTPQPAPAAPIPGPRPTAASPAPAVPAPPSAPTVAPVPAGTAPVVPAAAAPPPPPPAPAVSVPAPTPGATPAMPAATAPEAAAARLAKTPEPVVVPPVAPVAAATPSPPPAPPPPAVRSEPVAPSRPAPAAGPPPAPPPRRWSPSEPPPAPARIGSSRPSPGASGPGRAPAGGRAPPAAGSGTAPPPLPARPATPDSPASPPALPVAVKTPPPPAPRAASAPASAPLPAPTPVAVAAPIAPAAPAPTDAAPGLPVAPASVPSVAPPVALAPPPAAPPAEAPTPPAPARAAPKKRRKTPAKSAKKSTASPAASPPAATDSVSLVAASPASSGSPVPGAAVPVSPVDLPENAAPPPPPPRRRAPRKRKAPPVISATAGTNPPAVEGDASTVAVAAPSLPAEPAPMPPEDE